MSSNVLLGCSMCADGQCCANVNKVADPDILSRNCFACLQGGKHLVAHIVLKNCADNKLLLGCHTHGDEICNEPISCSKQNVADMVADSPCYCPRMVQYYGGDSGWLCIKQCSYLHINKLRESSRRGGETNHTYHLKHGQYVPHDTQGQSRH